MTGQRSKALPPHADRDRGLRLTEDDPFSSMAEHVEAIICLIRAGKIVYTNGQLERLTGYQRDELAAMDLYDLMVPEEAEMIRAHVAAHPVSAQNPVTHYQYRVRRKDGDLRWVDLSLKYVTLNGEAYSLATALDITASKQAEEALRVSEERYRNVVDNQTELVSRFSPDTTLTFVNEAYCRYFGRTRDELIGHSFLELVPEFEHEGIFRKLKAEMYSRESTVYTHQVNLPGGETRWQEWTDYPIVGPDDEVIEFQSVGRDVTARLRAEAERNQYTQWLEIIQRVDAELTQVLSFDYVLKIALDAAVRLSHANAGAIHLIEGEQMWVAHVIGNYPRTMLGSRMSTQRGIVGRVIRQGVAEFIQDVKADPDYIPNVAETVSQITVPLIARDRLLGAINVQTDAGHHFTPQIFDFLKLLTARIASALENARLYDVSQKQLAELQDLYQQVSSLEQLKTQMIRVAAHDLRNPLGVIGGYIQLLEIEMEGKLDDRLHEYLSIIKQSSDRIDKITRDILTMERVGASQELPMERVDLREVVLGACEDFRSQAQDKPLAVRLAVTDDPIYIRGDRVLLRETAGNLISNAIKYTPSGGQVEIRLHAAEKRAVFEVIDNGFGIPAEMHEKLFQPFFRVQSKETRSIKGTGLGLHLVKSIIERHQGHMRFQSEYGAGSTFGFELPLLKKSGAHKTRKTGTAASAG